MSVNNLAEKILFSPMSYDVNELYVLSAYATPNMLSWFMKNVQDRATSPISIRLIVGMIPFDNISVNAHEGFKEIVSSKLPKEISSVICSYVVDGPAVHTNLFLWCRKGEPVIAYTGSANFVQSSFIANQRYELMTEYDAAEAMRIIESFEAHTMYCNHSEIEEYIILRPTHPILDLENNIVDEDISCESVILSLITKNGEPGKRSGLNWGQRKGREPNQAYIPLPSKVAKSGFFPLDKRHFTVVTDDHKSLILRVEQQNNKAITTPARNSDLGEYFRNRLNLPNGTFITRKHLDDYGRTNVKFIKLDDETFYMDFAPFPSV